MKKIWSQFRAGLVALIPLFILAFIVKMIWGLFVALNIHLVGHPGLNYFLNFVALALFIFLAGWLLSISVVRNFLRIVLSKIPLLSAISDYFFDAESLEIIKKDSFPLVIFEFPGLRCRAFGLVTKEMSVVDSDGKEEVWCVVFYPTCPVPFTGLLFYFPKSSLKYTDLGFKDLMTIATSFGMKCNLLQFLNSKSRSS